MSDSIDFIRFTPDDAEIIADWLSSEPWPFHGDVHPAREAVLERARRGVYDNDRTWTFWMIDRAGERVGLIQLKDIGDSTPVFDLRIRGSRRGTGLGEQALRWITAHLFTELPDIIRIEGTTRADNVAMRNLFLKCGYVKEAHYRRAWRTGDVHYDAIGFAILRDDWANGTVTECAAM